MNRVIITNFTVFCAQSIASGDFVHVVLVTVASTEFVDGHHCTILTRIAQISHLIYMMQEV